MALDFPNSPVNGQTYAGFVYDSTEGVWRIRPGFSSPAGISATTGSPAEVTSGGYKYYTFTGNGSITVDVAGLAGVFLVAGGGGGGCGNGSTERGGGGGAGGFFGLENFYLPSGTHTVLVGAGGAGAASGGANGTSGNPSSLGSLISISHGGGGTGTTLPGRSGGSGGGASGGSTQRGFSVARTIQGYDGGQYISGGNGAGGGGGGADGGNNNAGGAGGIGTSLFSAWGLATSTGENSGGTVYFCGGGSGGVASGTNAGGIGGGGDGSANDATAGDANTGGGGGGEQGSSAGAGGSGIVIVRVAV